MTIGFVCYNWLPQGLETGNSPLLVLSALRCSQRPGPHWFQSLLYIGVQAMDICDNVFFWAGDLSYQVLVAFFRTSFHFGSVGTRCLLLFFAPVFILGTLVPGACCPLLLLLLL